ncbi:hypothetical protein [Methylobacterium radiodurans]|uniref:Uncharacterized protein n=1 Tax=Methylobacterium radiodurans TaxID=2202828 RepID=A0A2U8VUH3_9HYPH|nr:hypothetical protein [Methylobacterium radiodurans]AWN36892.1 hypothetical protein DK427_15075 [Methylobacterium radiodurans]
MNWACLQRSAIAAAIVLQPVAAAQADRLSLSTTEARTVLFIRTDPDKVAKALPAGWTAVPGSGATKDANLVLILIEGFAQSDAEGEAAPYPDKYAVWGTSAKNDRGAAGFMVVGGLIAPAQGAPGAYGVYRPARVTMSKTSRADEGGATQVEESWDFATDDGDRLRLAARYARGLGTRSRVEPKVYTVAKPDFHRVYKAEQVSEIVHAGPAGPSGSTVAFGASGPVFSGLLDDGAQVVAVASVPAYHRQIFLPD